MSDLNRWLNGQPEPEPKPADPMAPYREALERLEARPRMVDPATVTHLEPDYVNHKIRTFHGRQALALDVAYPERNTCPGCLHQLVETLAKPVPGAEAN